MVNHSSASVRVEKPHATATTQIRINDALRRRAQAAIHDRSIDPQWRNIIRYALEIKFKKVARQFRTGACRSC